MSKHDRAIAVLDEAGVPVTRDSFGGWVVGNTNVGWCSVQCAAWIVRQVLDSTSSRPLHGSRED